MTLQELLNYAGNNPQSMLFYFGALPLAAVIVGLLDQQRGHNAPWNYLYAALIYLSAVPGIFALTLIVYQFLFERTSIMNLDVVSQLLPILSMLLTLGVVRRNVDLNYIPGFDKLSGLLFLIAATLGLMWLADRTRIFAFVSMPFYAVVLVFFGLLFAMRFGFKQAFGPGRRN
jgi:hypothetical protein